MVLLTAVLLILSFSTVVLAVAAENARDAAAWVGTFELTGQANVNVCGAVTQAEQQNDTSNRPDIHSHSPRFPQALVDQHSPVGPIELGHLDGVPAFVTPVQVPTNPIHRQAIWVTQGGPVQNLPRQWATGPKDGPPHPVSPEDVVSIHSQAKWMHRLILQQDLQRKHFPIISQNSTPQCSQREN
ncbi:hypothetical protein EYF80_007324 [Liparis tanakae]|uniref:Uncharacterized protein n=1 Tax=Liparis tanakae TaxID=230148 RepID=A0A4Z2IWW9_9TELE|nr:hypothetical protein EYF80_007324 [Liparis tanakae]